MATTSFPTDKQLPNTDNIIRQTDCSYSFQQEAVSLTLKFMGDVKEAVGLAAAYRAGTRVAVSDLTGKFTELNNVLPTSQLEASGKVTASTSTTKTGSGTVSITVSVPYKTKIAIGSGEGSDPEKRIITTWSEKSTDYEFPLEIYAGDGTSASECNAGNLEAWKQEKNKNIQNYKDFKYTIEGESEPVELEGRTLDLAKKIYSGIESVRRAYPEVIRTTQYLNYKADEDKVDDTLIRQIQETPKLYYRDQTPHEIWKSLFDNFDWLKASYDVNTEATEYQKLWNITVTETWIGCDIDEKGTWDDDLYGPDGTRWKFASAQNQAQANVDGNPVNGNGRVNPTTFQNQKDIKKLDLNNAYTAVDANSFKANPTRGTRSASTGIPDLETITMPSVSFIGDDAFNGAANLKAINLTNQITYMGERVFQGCTSMTEAIVEPWIYDLPASTFEGCTALKAWSGNDGIIIDGLVKTIGDACFKDCTSLEKVSCTNAITSVGDNAFENDAALTSFSTGMDSQGTITLGDEAFKGCSHLATIDIPIATITVGTDTFANALTSALKLRVPVSFLSNVPSGTTYSYAYPGYVESIAANEFKDNTSITGIEIPESVTTVGDAAFQGCTALTSVALQNALIGNSMFRQCTALTSIDIPETVTSIGTYAFQGCTGLTSVEIPETVTSIGDSIFRGCTGITSATVGEGVTAIPNNAFRGCSALTSIDLQGNVTSVGEYSFAEIAATSLTFHDGLTSIAASAFRSMTNCATFNFEECTSVPTLADVNAFLYTPNVKKIWIPYDLASTWLSATNWDSSTNQINASLGYRYAYADGTTSIAASAWQNDTHLFEVTIPDSVTSIGGNAFNGCSNLGKFVCDDATSWCSKSFGSSWLVGTYWDLYEGSEKVTSLTLGGAPSARCFYRNKSLVSVTIPEGLTSSGASSFEACQNLTTVTLPSTLTTIPQYSFHACPALTTINIPSGVTSIGTMALRNCTSLTTLTIPSATTTIDANAFQYMGPTGSSVEVTMEGKTTTDVQGMTNYPWGLRVGTTIHCTDADITI